MAVPKKSAKGKADFPPDVPGKKANPFAKKAAPDAKKGDAKKENPFAKKAAPAAGKKPPVPKKKGGK